ncbi:GNAT family N-acetyltransferase [Methanolobus sp. ZRKC3]|uniref:GNAT family N-acetyltransferase n=1 Tax=Methanolobus sp. ZRKC3 TaxID=3125786 RepID=UPI00324B78D2
MNDRCNLQSRWTQGLKEFDDAFSVRKEVFIIEQDIDEEIEVDEFDDISWHLVLYDSGKPVATGRIFKKADSFVIGRICVLKEYRGRSIGNLLMELLMERANDLGARRLRLDSQLYAIDFYRRFGFREYGEIFLDAGIEHLKMVKEIL